MRRSDRGATAVEFAVLLPAVVLLIGLVAAGGRIWYARSTVEQLAGAASRAASIARTPAAASADAHRVVALDATDAGLSCAGGAPALELDLAGFSVPVGQPARVGAVVRCDVPLSDVLLPGLPGTLPVESEGQSPLDRYRGRR